MNTPNRSPGAGEGEGVDDTRHPRPPRHVGWRDGAGVRRSGLVGDAVRVGDAVGFCSSRAVVGAELEGRLQNTEGSAAYLKKKNTRV